MNKNVGLFFGTFDPLHNGHIAIAKYFLKELNLDEIWFVITPLSPFKQENKVTSYYDRFKIINNYCKKNSKIICSDVEFDLKPPYNTADTLTHLNLEYPSTVFKIILGEDNLNTLHLWSNHQLILEHKICVYPRISLTKEKSQLISHPNVNLYNAPIMEISSTLIRKNILQKISISHLVPKEIEEMLIK
ncbi:nicotinate (nicotinamide) nucleotide adenylyltransferase [Flavobacteriaceae bacterium]|nr:nicotinate (nicotinamide) nucleotide adenylyltransferase [Flavobacteriaceae bacterium]